MRALVLMLALAAPVSFGTTLFSESFEGSFPAPNWVTNFSGTVAVDPTNAANHAVRFTNYGSGGDMWSATIPIPNPASSMVRISFDFLNMSAVSSNTGGYLNNSGGW